MSARTTRLVIEREVREAARRKGIWALVLLTFLGSLTLVLLPTLYAWLEGRADNPSRDAPGAQP